MFIYQTLKKQGLQHFFSKLPFWMLSSACDAKFYMNNNLSSGKSNMGGGLSGSQSDKQ